MLFTGVVIGLAVSWLVESFIVGFLTLAVIGGLGWLFLGRSGTDNDPPRRRPSSDEPRSAREPHEHQHARL